MLGVWQKRAQRLVRELWRQRVVSLLFLGSVAFVIARTVLLSVHELFPGGAQIGEIIFDLAIAYIAAWIFNLLIVVMPQLDSRDRVLVAAGRLIDRLTEVGSAIPGTLARGARVKEPQDGATVEWLTRVGVSIRKSCDWAGGLRY